ncbi:MAG TPA: FtsX-like permease family protein [Solirubrobacteraceae bacterium]
MLASFDGLALRQLGTRRLRAALTAFGIVLGVGMVFAVLLLVGTIRHTFDDVINSAWGSTDLVAMPEAGGTLPQSAIDRVRSTKGVESAAGMVGGTAVRLDARDHAVKGIKGQMWVAGMDPQPPFPYDFRYVAGRPFRHGTEIAVERNWARDRHVRVGDRIRVATPSGRAALHVVGIFTFSNGLSFGGAGLAGMAQDGARRLMGVPRGWHQISVMAADPAQVRAIRGRLRAELGAGVTVKTPTEFGDQIGEQMRALNVVLYFFSGIALFVGGFLILNSFNMTVVQRLRELGTLRTLGATRGMVTRSVLVEALALGLLGTAGGLAAGLGLTIGLIELMRGVGVPVGNLHLTATAAVVALALGLVVTLVSAAWPARRASRVPPIQAVLGTGLAARRSSWRRVLAGVVLFVPGAVAGGEFWFGGNDGGGGLQALGGIALTVAMLAGVALAAPAIITPLARALAAGLRCISPTAGRLASDSIGRNPARTAATAVALTMGLSIVVINSAMSSSIKGTINASIDRSFARDFTVQPVGQGLEGGGQQTVPPALGRRVGALPGVDVVTPVSATFTKLPGLPSGRLAIAVGVDPVAYGRVDTSPVLGTSRATALRALAAGGVLVPRGYAREVHLAVGSALTLRGPAGVRRVRVAGILDGVSTFGAEVVQVSQRTMRAVYGISRPAQLAVKLGSAADRGRVDAAIRRLVDRDYPGLEVLSSADVKAQVSSRVQQQFNLFNAIIAIAVIVSLLGVINTLAMAVIERTREIGVMRALGASRWLVRRTMLDESLLITVSGALAGIGVGGLIAWLWLRSVSDVLPLDFRFPWTAAIWVAAAAVLLGVLASIVPARRAARLKVIDALNYE